MKLKRVYLKHGAWHYVDPAGKWHWLCRESAGEVEMMRAYAALRNDVLPSMPNLAREWADKKLGKYSPDVKREYRRMTEIVAKAFGEFGVGDVRTIDVAEFLSTNFSDKPNAARKYAALMSKMFRLSIAKGMREINPCRDLDLSDYEMRSRKVLLPHGAVKRICEAGLTGKDGRPTASGEMFCCIVDAAYLLFQRAQDIRRLTEFQVGTTHITFRPGKTAKSTGGSVELLITPAIQELLDRAREIKTRRRIASSFLFPTTSGTAYSRSGLYTMWRRAKARAGITEDYDFMDLRALGATDAKRQGASPADIQRRLVHASAGTTDVYLRERSPEVSAIDLRVPWRGGNE